MIAYLKGTPQGFGPSTAERIPLPERDSMSAEQQAAADAIVNGPRKAIFGPFVPLLQTPILMERIGDTGAALRFHGTLPDRVRELVICFVARETSNQFEWQTHVPLAIAAGISATVIDALAAGRFPRDLPDELASAADFTSEMIRSHAVSDATYSEAVACFGVPGTVELAALAGYFAMVCWIMNVARTPGPKGAEMHGLMALPG